MSTTRTETGVVEMDIRGQICPSCLLLALKEVNDHAADLRAGHLELRILTDSRQATATIPEAVNNMGFEVEIDKTDGHYTVAIRGAR